LLLGVLLSSATGYVLAAFHRSDARSGEAGIKYYLLGALTNGAMVYGAVLLFGLGATTTLPGLREALPGADPVALVAATGLVVLGLAFKLGAVPAHAWVADVADGAPAPSAAFLTVAPKVGALVALARLAATLPEDAVGWRPLVAVLAAATMTLGNLAALGQDDVRRLLGWSAVSQSGYGLMAVVALGRSELAVPALVFFIAAYAAANLAAFGVVVELRGRRDRASYAGLATARPVLAALLVLGLLSLVGIPPLAGFAAKVALFGAAVDAGYTWLAVLAVANTVVSLAYYLRVIAPAYFEPLPAPVPVLGRYAHAGTLAAAGAVVGLGLAAEPLLGGAGVARLLPG
ncbi:MAG: NADH-quinone oxidoreductase subunit N, partial [Actinomycetota bacterium]|nr:NADH-quinone oxidoreductase subunit N [Actinomycetota bacterium]